MSKNYSIRHFLTQYLVFLAFLITVVPAIWVYVDAVHEVEELFDASLVQSARVMHGIITKKAIKTHRAHLEQSLANKKFDLDLFDDEATPYGHKYEKKIFFQVWDNNKNLLLKSNDAPDESLSHLQPGFMYKTFGDYTWRTFTLYSEMDDYWLVMAERDDIRNELTHNIAIDHLIPIIIAIPLAAIFVWLTVAKGLKPLQIIAQKVDTQDYQCLKKIEPKKSPLEIESLVLALNSLFTRLNDSYQHEKRFTSDAAHELRTPIASLMVHIDNAIQESDETAEQNTTNDELKESLFDIKSSVLRLSHLVVQLLALSRADSLYLADDYQPQDLILVCQEAIKANQSKQLKKNQQLTLNFPSEECFIRGNETLLLSLFGNLIDNAIRYTPEQGRISISLTIEDNQVAFIVEDSGPGIPNKLLERVKDRFYRIDTNQQQGCGLGLSIVEKIVEIHNAKLTLGQSKLNGLSVSVIFLFE